MTSVPSLKAPSPNTHILRFWGLGLQHIKREREDTIQPRMVDFLEFYCLFDFYKRLALTTIQKADAKQECLLP